MRHPTLALLAGAAASAAVNSFFWVVLGAAPDWVFLTAAALTLVLAAAADLC